MSFWPAAGRAKTMRSLVFVSSARAPRDSSSSSPSPSSVNAGCRLTGTLGAAGDPSKREIFSHLAEKCTWKDACRCAVVASCNGAVYQRLVSPTIHPRVCRRIKPFPRPPHHVVFRGKGGLSPARYACATTSSTLSSSSSSSFSRFLLEMRCIQPSLFAALPCPFLHSSPLFTTAKLARAHFLRQLDSTERSQMNTSAEKTRSVINNSRLSTCFRAQVASETAKCPTVLMCSPLVFIPSFLARAERNA